MENGLNFFEVSRTFFYITCPVIFVYGIILVLYRNYKRLEEFLAREIVKERIMIPALETKILNFHQWMLEKQTFIGIVCIAYSVFIFFILYVKA